MKLEARRIDGFLRDPGPARAVLLHGDDHGLIRERADALTRAVAGSLDDPFRVAALEGGSAALEEEASALSLIGGRRVVRVRDAGDAMLAAVERVLARGGDTLIVLEAQGLPAKSRLRAALERAPAAAAVIACYPEEGRALGASLRAMIEAEGCRVSPEAVALLSASLGADRAATRNEVEKLVLYAGEGGLVDLDAVEACIADASSLSLDHALFAATAGEVAACDRALERAISDGAAAVAMTRALLMHLHRLQRAREAMAEEGTGPADATRNARPPVFFRHAAAFTTALARWGVEGLARAASETSRIELACKRTGAPDLLLVRNLFGRIARQSARGSR